MEDMLDDIFDDMDSGLGSDDNDRDNDSDGLNDDNDLDDNDRNILSGFDDFYENIFGDDLRDDSDDRENSLSESGGFMGLRQMFGGRNSDSADRSDRNDDDDDDDLRNDNNVFSTNAISNVISNTQERLTDMLFPEMNFEVPERDFSNPFESLLNFDVPNLSVLDAAETVVDRVSDVDVQAPEIESPLSGSLNFEVPEIEGGDAVERVSESISDLTLPKLGLMGEMNFGDSFLGDSSFSDSSFGDSNIGDSNFVETSFGDSSFGDSGFGFHDAFSSFGNAVTDVASSFADRVAPDFSLPNYSFESSSYFGGFNNDNVDNSRSDSSFDQNSASNEED